MNIELLRRLSEVLPNDANGSILAALQAIDQCLPMRMASNWRHNSLAGTVTIDGRLHHHPRSDERGEHVHPITDGLLGWMHKKIQREKVGFVRVDDLQSPDILRVHLSADRIKQLNLRRLICIPYNNLVADKSEADAPAGFVNLYPQEGVNLTDDEIQFVKSRLCQLETMQFLRAKDMLATETLGILSGSLEPEGVLKAIIQRVCTKFFSVEACSIYEWSTRTNVFTIAATTGLDKQQTGFDFKGSGLVGEVIRLEKHIVIQDISNPSEIRSTLGVHKTTEELLMNMEELRTPPRSILLVPIYNPALPSADGPPIGVIRFVNKHCRNSLFADAFSQTDISLATELSRLLAFYEDHKRLERSRLAFALHFGHEAQAPAVGIKGTAERLLRHPDENSLPKAMQQSMLQDILSFSELLIAFSDSITFGFADRSKPMKSRYRIRSGNLRTAIEQAKKVVIPICRKEDIVFNKIVISGKYPDLFFDTGAFTQVFYNLFTNAIKYRSREPGSDFSVLVTCTEDLHHDVSITTKDSDGMPTVFEKKVIQGHRIEIQDTGIGIPEEYKRKIFAEGFRVPEVASLEIRGSGIGLSVVRNILHDFQCSISLSKLKGPTTFRIFVPKTLQDRDYVNQLGARPTQEIGYVR